MRSKGKSIHPVQTAIEFIQHENIKKYDEGNGRFEGLILT
tara:strand:- start:929 stop:1048 length:120 start_codon:yes stop_codon:yes gene_type:complete